MEILPLSNVDRRVSLDLRPNITLSPSLSTVGSLSIVIAPAIKEAERKIKEQSTFFNTLTSYSIPTVESLVANDNVPVKGFNSHLPNQPNSLILEERNKALTKIQSLLAKVNELKNTIIAPEDDIICPYEQTKVKYLGVNYVAPSIEELSYPESFSIQEALPSTAAINANYYNIMLTQVGQMTAEAVDTGFPGITSENVGNAFAQISATNEGNKYIINAKKMADHIEFAEIVRSISMQQIIDDPKEIAYKLIHRFIEINSDIDLSKNLPYFTSPVTIPNFEPIPQPVLEPQQAPRTEQLPINHPALQYIAQPSYWQQTSQIQEKV